MQHARTILADALGAARGSGSLCALCGESPFGAAGSTRSVLGPNFVDFWAIERPDADSICQGCARCLAGRPGDDPPPLRTRSVLVVDGSLTVLDRPALWDAITAPASTAHVLSWSTGGKIHHWLHAGVSTADRLMIGSDRSCIAVTSADRPLADAVLALVAHFPRAAVVGGDYHPKAVQSFSAARWAQLDRAVEPYRPSPLLDLLCYCAPKPDAPDTENAHEELMIDPAIQTAANLLACIAGASEYRATRGKEFWSGFFRHRVERHKRLPLAECVSRLLDACQSSATAETTREATAWLAQACEGECASVERALRTNTALVVALSYEGIQARKATR